MTDGMKVTLSNVFESGVNVDGWMEGTRKIRWKARIWKV